MKSKKVPAIVIIVVSLFCLVERGLCGAGQVHAEIPNGVAFSEFRGYDSWQDVAVSATEEGIKAILGNPRDDKRVSRKAFPAMASLFPMAP
jgi:hypothetical protein